MDINPVKYVPDWLREIGYRGDGLWISCKANDLLKTTRFKLTANAYMKVSEIGEGMDYYDYNAEVERLSEMRLYLLAVKAKKTLHVMHSLVCLEEGGYKIKGDMKVVVEGIDRDILLKGTIHIIDEDQSTIDTRSYRIGSNLYSLCTVSGIDPSVVTYEDLRRVFSFR